VGAENLLYFGDNLGILRDRSAFPDECVDLIYLDPPFNSNATYNVLFAEQDGSRSPAQIRAFEDTWTWDEGAAWALKEGMLYGGKLADCLSGFQVLLGASNMMAYLAMMAPRLAELRRVLKPTGSIYLHCDPTASHYLKVLMDAIFGPERFLNEIVWRRYSRPKGSQYVARRYGASTDSLLFYAKSDAHRFYADNIKTPLTKEEIAQRYTHKDEKGPYYSGPLLRSPAMGERPNLVYEYKGFTPGPEGWRLTKEKLTVLDEQGDMFWTSSGIPRRKVRPQIEPGRLVDNLWADIEAVGSQARERLGYPTQKPLALLERIILASSKEGDVVLDPFCGCGTAVVGAEKLNRRWVGIDITHVAISLIKSRIRDTFGEEHVPHVEGAPTSVPDAQALADEDRYQFQWWALGLVDAFGVEKKKGADRGVDGRLYFEDGPKGQMQKVVVSVKSGKVGARDVRDLIGAVGNERASLGVLLALQEPTPPMRKAAASAGFYESPGHGTQHSRVQIFTIEELLNGAAVDYPSPSGANRTFRRAPKTKKPKPEALQLPV